MAVKTILHDWQKWGLSTEPTLVQEFEAGLNHDVYLIESNGTQYVLKHFNTDSSKCLTNALRAQTWASKLDLAPSLLYSDSAKHYCLMEFIEQDSGEDARPRLLARSIAKLHRTAPPQHPPSFDVLAHCEDYLAVLSKHMDQYSKEHQVLHSVLDYFSNDSTPWVFCHNDLVTANCLVQAERMKFIDWEFAALNNPWFDLAALAYYFELNDKQLDMLLRTYWQCEPFRPPIFYAASCAVIWLDMLWFAHGSPRLALADQYDKLRALTEASARFYALI